MRCTWVLLVLSVFAQPSYNQASSVPFRDEGCGADSVVEATLRRLAASERRCADSERRCADSERRIADSERRLADLEKRLANSEKDGHPPAAVAFMGMRTTPLIAETPANMTYDITQTNVGGAFQGSTGIFIAPRDGVYYFFFSSLQYASGGKHSHLFLYHNDAVICSAFTAAGHGSQLSNSAVISMQEGDIVRIQTLANEHFYGDTSAYTTFLGMILY